MLLKVLREKKYCNECFTDFGGSGSDEFEYFGHWGPAKAVLGHDFSFVFGSSVQSTDVVGHAMSELFAGNGWKDDIVPFVPHAVVAVNWNVAEALVLLRKQVQNKM